MKGEAERPTLGGGRKPVNSGVLKPRLQPAKDAKVIPGLLANETIDSMTDSPTALELSAAKQ